MGNPRRSALGAAGPDAEARLRLQVNAGYAVAVLLMALFGWLSWRLAQQAGESAGWVAHTHEVSTTLETTLRHLIDVETGMRGFSLTGAPNFLEPFNSGREQVPGNLRHLAMLVADDPAQEQQVNTLFKQANATIKVCEANVATRRDTETIPSVAQLEQGKHLMDATRVTIAQMEEEQEQLLKQGIQRTLAARRFTASAIGLGSILGVISLFIAGMTVNREIGSRHKSRVLVQQTEDKVKHHAALLDLASDAILVRDLQSRVIFLNRAAQDMYGMSAEEASGRVSHELLHTEFPIPLAAIEAALTSEGYWEGELRHRTRHGTELVVASRWSLQRNETGVPTTILEMNRDITERKQAEAALGESEGRLSGIIASAMDAIVTVDEQQRVVLFNSAAEKMFRSPACESMGKPITTFIPPRFRASHAGHIQRFGETGVTNRAMGSKNVLWALRADGQEFQIEASISQVVTGGKKLFTVILRDVTERTQAEEMRERLAAVVDSSEDAIISKTLEGVIVAWNRGAEKVFGYSVAEMVGKPILRLIPPDRIDEESDILRRIGLGESIEHFETVRVRKDGTKIDVSVTISPIRDVTGAIVGASKIARDITERKRGEEELLHSRQALESQTFMLQSVLDSMVEGLAVADEQGKLIIWNPAAEKIVGLGLTLLPPDKWSAHYGVYLPDKVTRLPPGETPLERAMRGEAVNTEIFLRNPGLDREVWLEINGSPLRGKDGVLQGGVAAFRDITRRKADELEIRKLNEELEERIAKRTEQLEAANRELEAFSYSVSHDLRTPLRHIAGFSRILRNEFGAELAAEAREHLQRIEDAVRRMGLLVDALHSMALLRRQSLRLQHSELNPIVSEVISILEPECEGRDVEWRIGQLPALDCDPVLIGQVFQNLLSNALKYSRGRNRAVIEVDSIQEPDKPVILLVRDNGAGFDMKYAQKLFGMFQRMHTESEFEGTGVGLATVHRIIQKHGGTIWAEAEVDRGATFYFALQSVEQLELTPKAADFSMTWPNRGV